MIGTIESVHLPMQCTPLLILKYCYVLRFIIPCHSKIPSLPPLLRKVFAQFSQLPTYGGSIRYYAAEKAAITIKQGTKSRSR